MVVAMTTSTAVRDALPLLLPGVPVFCRPPGRIQVGADPRRGVVFEPPRGADPVALAALLGELRRPQTVAGLRERIKACGLTAGALISFLDELLTARLAVPAPQPTLLRPVIRGTGRLAALLAEGMAEAGLPVAGAAEFVGRGHRPNLVLLAGGPVPDPAITAPLMRDRIPHLRIEVHDGIGTIGPLVLPGLSSCLRCHDLHRTAADPQWPVLAARLCSAPGQAGAATVRATAALATVAVEELFVLLAAATVPPPVPAPLPALLGRALELRPGEHQVVIRDRPTHPGCGCVSRVDDRVSHVDDKGAA